MTRFSLRISTLLCATAVCALLPMETNAAPDLTGQVTPSVTPQGSTSLVSFDIKILNLGNAGCGVAWWADFWASYPCACSVPPSACNQASDANWDFTASDLAAGTTLSKSFNLQLSASPTPYRYLLYVDSALGTFGNFCAEGNETNNIICGEYSVTGPSVSPDLVIEACSAEPDPADLSLTRFTMVVKNQ